MPEIATCVLINDDEKILILKRSEKVSTYKGMWGAVAGYVEEDEEPHETAFKEIREETGLKKDEIKLLKQLDPIEFFDLYEGKYYHWIIFPFLFKSEKKDKVNIDWEHTEYRWVNPSELKNYNTVSHLIEIVSKLLK